MKYLFCFTSLLLLISCQSTGVDAELLESMIESQERAARVIEEQNDVVIANLEELLRDDSKRKYRPIQMTVDSIQNVINEARKKIRDLQAALTNQEKTPSSLPNLNSLTNEIQALPEEILIFTKNLYEVYADSFGLDTVQAKSRLSSLQTSMPKYDETFNVHDLTSTLSQRCWLSKTMSELASTEALVTSSLIELTGGRMISCFFGFQPVVYDITPNDLGDSVSTFLILLDNPELSISAENFSLFVDGQKTAPFQGMYAYYQRKSATLLKDSISLNGHYFNRLTGERIDLFATNFFTLPLE